MKFSTIALLLFVAQIASAQIFKVRSVHSADNTKQFVVIESTERPAIAKKINERIKQDWGYDANAKDPFETSAVVEDAEFSSNVGANNERVFSIHLESSYAAAGLHVTESTYQFDAKTGELIDLNKIFGGDGQAKLNKMLHKSWKAALKAAADDVNESRREEYKECLKTADQTEVSIQDFMVMDNRIYFWAGSCLEGTTYDFKADRSPGPHVYLWNELLPYLTPYGFSLFYDKGTPPFQTLMRGLIDQKYPISFVLLQGKDGSVTGYLTYDRIGEPISVKGNVNGKIIKFNELDKDGKPLSDIDISWDGVALGGSFTNLKSKKEMSFTGIVVVK